MKGLKYIGIVAMACISQWGYGQEGTVNDVREKYHQKLEEENKGVAVLVKKDGKIHTTGIGKFGLNEHSVFNIGSATKTFTVILLLQEEEKGNLRLEDSIGTYLSPIKNVDGSLTIETLMTHESGLDEVIGGNLSTIFNAQDDALYETRLLDEIGESDPDLRGKFDYCNTNYFLLGLILEKVTDKSYFDLLQERILDPVGMENSYPYVSKSIENLAMPMMEGENVYDKLDYRFFANIAYAAGSIASTLEDMEQFFVALFETTTLLKKESVQRMMHAGNEIYGLGLFKADFAEQPYFGHGGNNIGYAFRNGYDPKTKNMYLIFSNNRSVPNERVLTEDVIRVMNGEHVEGFQTFDKTAFQHFVGKFELKEAGLIFEISEENGVLMLNVPSQGITSELKQKDTISLVDTQVGASFQIVEGNSDQIKFAQNGFETTLNRVGEE